MSTDNPPEAPDNGHLVALSREDDIYVEAPESHYIDDEAATMAELRRYVQRHHTRKPARVVLCGHEYWANILVPKSGDDFAYVATNADRVPTSQPLQLRERLSSLLPSSLFMGFGLGLGLGIVLLVGYGRGNLPGPAPVVAAVPPVWHAAPAYGFGVGSQPRSTDVVVLGAEPQRRGSRGQSVDLLLVPADPRLLQLGQEAPVPLEWNGIRIPSGPSESSAPDARIDGPGFHPSAIASHEKLVTGVEGSLFFQSGPTRILRGVSSSTRAVDTSRHSFGQVPGD